MNEKVEKLLRQPTISVDDAAKVLGIGRNAAYMATRTGQIETMEVGKRKLVLTAPLRRKLGLEVAS
jgi:hypothetical protein